MDKKLLDILCCPVSKQSLALLNSKQLACLNAAIHAQTAIQLDGVLLSSPLKEALIREDQQRLYRIDDGIPVLLSEEAVLTNTLSNWV